MQKPADIRKHVLMGHNATKYGGVALYVHEHAGEMWATNKSWATRAERIAPLLEQYNLSTAAPGCYEVAATVRATTSQVPNMPAELVDESRFEPGARLHVAGHPAFIQGSTGTLCEVYALADGTHAALRADESAWLAEMWTAPLADPALRYDGLVHVLFRKPETGGVQALFSAKVKRVITPYRHGTDPETREPVSVPAVEEPAGSRVLGIMMGWLPS